MHRLRVAAFLAIVGLAVARLQAAGGGPLGGPHALSAVPAWLHGTDPVIASFALLQFLALALGWYVLAVTVLGGAARACRAHRLTGVLDVITFPGIRRLLNAAGVAFVVSTTLPAATAWATPAPPPLSAPPLSAPPVMHWLGQLGPLAAGPRLAPAAPAAPGPSPLPSTTTTTLRNPTTVPPAPPTPLAPDAAAPSATAPGSSRPGAPSAQGWTGAARPLGPGTHPLGPENGRTTTTTTTSTPDSGPATWTVRPGDHFWYIAETTLASARGRPVSDAEVAAYWLTVIQANRDRLAVPSEPSFIYPGQVFVLPPTPPAPTPPAPTPPGSS